jgi:hypothetical protein
MLIAEAAPAHDQAAERGADPFQTLQHQFPWRCWFQHHGDQLVKAPLLKHPVAVPFARL